LERGSLRFPERGDYKPTPKSKKSATVFRFIYALPIERPRKPEMTDRAKPKKPELGSDHTTPPAAVRHRGPRRVERKKRAYFAAIRRLLASV